MKKITQVIFLIAIFLSAAVGIFALVRLLDIYSEYEKGNNTYEVLEDFVKKPDHGEETEDKPKSVTDAVRVSSQELIVDFESLRAINPDVAAWIEIPALNISYPVVQGTDNSYYLHHLFSGESNINGSIFVDFHNKQDFSDENTIVYGHNMKNGSMFGTLSNYQNPDVYTEYPCFYIYIPGYCLEYQVFSCYATKTGSIGYTYAFPGIEEYQVFVDTVSSYAGYSTGVEMAVTDKVVTLSTCVNSDRDYRFLVHGKLIKKSAVQEEKSND